MAGTVDWSDSPIVDLYEEGGLAQNHAHITWNLPETMPSILLGDSIRIRIRLTAGTLQSTVEQAKFRFRVETLDHDFQVASLVNESEMKLDQNQSIVQNISIPLVSNILIFKVSVGVKHYHAAHAGVTRTWIEDAKVLNAYVQYFGDFSLDYVPITILYCPPCQDMTNALTQGSAYGTTATIGESKSATSSSTESEGLSIGGGVTVKAGFLPLNAQVEGNGTSGQEYAESQSIENSSGNTVTFGYEWNTTLVADNQKNIGRAFWGPLGDIFVLLKNPWFSLHGDIEGRVSVGIPRKNYTAPQILILPAHKLLRPSGDPIAEKIPANVRRNILELDPFIVNLHKFFPVDLGCELSDAVDSYRDPSVGYGTGFEGGNRAALIAKYSIGNGVELNLMERSQIQCRDNRTNETTFISQVSDRSGFSTSFNFNLFFGVGGSTTQQSSTSLTAKIAYQSSYESRLSFIRTAMCRLVRNQVEADLTGLEIWWDKIFSTFMFRRVDPGAGQVCGTALGLHNHVLELRSQRMTFYTMTDHRGRFCFKNISFGDYQLRVGGQQRRIRVDPNGSTAGKTSRIIIKGAKRILNIKRSTLWELADALDVHISQARAIQLTLSKVNRPFTRAKVENVLKAYNLAPSKVKERVILRFR